jgi:hypothetical protein
MFLRVLALIVVLLLMIGGLVLAAVIAITSIASLERVSATAHSDDIWNTHGSAGWERGQLSVWVYTPFVAPGEPLALDAGIYGGLRAAVDQIDGSLGGQRFTHRGKGPVWGMSFVRKQNSSMARAIEPLQLRIPVDARPGDVLDLQLEVRHTLATSGAGGFRNQKALTSLTMPIQVRSPAEAVLARCWSAARAVLAFVVVFLLGRWIVAALRGLPWAEPRPNSLGGTLLGVGGLFGLLAFGYVGYLVFALPLLAAAGWRPDCLGNVLVGVWVVGLLGLIWRFPVRRWKQ